MILTNPWRSEFQKCICVLYCVLAALETDVQGHCLQKSNSLPTDLKTPPLKWGGRRVGSRAFILSSHYASFITIRHPLKILASAVILFSALPGRSIGMRMTS